MPQRLLRVETMEPMVIQGAIDALRRAGCMIRRVQPIRATLEDM